MENAANALGMAAAVLIFIIAIGSSFSLFGTAKQTADSIIRMRDKQAYLESAELDNGILYTSSSAIKGNGETGDITIEHIAGVTQKGDRIVSIADVIFTISRYSIEKYGVTIMNKNGEILRRYDANTEMLMSQYSNIDKTIRDDDGKNKYEEYIKELNKNTKTAYVSDVKFSDDTFQNIYRVTGNTKIECGAPWYGNEEQIQKRINADISGGTYISLNGYKYEGYDLLGELKDKKIVEVTNEIDIIY